MTVIQLISNTPCHNRPDYFMNEKCLPPIQQLLFISHSVIIARVSLPDGEELLQTAPSN